MQDFITDLSEPDHACMVHRLRVQPDDFILDILIYAESLVYFLDSGYLGGFLGIIACLHLHRTYQSRLSVQGIHGARLLQFLPLFHSPRKQPGLLVVYDIASYLLPENGRVAVSVEIVVGNLECETEVVAESVQEFAGSPVRSGDDGAEFGRTGDENCRFQPDHLQVRLHRDVVRILEIHIILLSFADLGGRHGKEVQDFGKDGGRSLGYPAVAVYQHHVSRKDSGIVAPFAADCRNAPAHIGIVHYVIVNQSEAVEYFQGGSRFENAFVDIVPEKGIGKKAETGAHPFSADSHHIPQRVVKPIRFIVECNVFEQTVYSLLNPGFSDHTIVFKHYKDRKTSALRQHRKEIFPKFVRFPTGITIYGQRHMQAENIATVVKHTGSHYLLSRLPEWDLFPAVLRGRIRLKGSGSTNPVAVGDRVVYECGDGHPTLENPAVIRSVAERTNYVIRKSANLSRQSHIIAANVDQAMIVATLDFPEVKLPFLDRILVTCEIYSVHPVIVLNKIDLFREAYGAQLDAFHRIYEGAGYGIIEVSALTGEGVQELRSACKDRISLFSGVSGVGKSSLIKALDPSVDVKIGEISEAHLQGRHTTTFYEMYPLSSGGFIIDTPGIRGFGLVDVEPEEIALYFPEMLRASEKCRFTPCTHTHEPGCAVKAAVEEGTISYERYSSYIGMLDEGKKYR